MAEFSPEQEPNGEPPIDRRLVVGRLKDFGVRIELADLDDLDDNDVLGSIVMWATMYDFDMDDILPQVTPIEHRKRDDAAGIATIGDKYEV